LKIAVVTENDLSELIGLVIGSSKIKSLVVQQEGGCYNMRPSLHLLWYSPSGTGKSAVLKDVARVLKTDIYSNITYSSLVGSVDKHLNPVVAGAWSVFGKVFVIDEFRCKNDDESDFLDAMNRLWEDQEYSRKLGRKATPIKLKKEKGYFFEVGSDGLIRIKTRFASIIAGMFDYPEWGKVSVQTKALISRCIPVSFRPSRDFLLKVANGKGAIKIREFPFDKRNENVMINLDDYKKILDFVSNYEGLQDVIYLRSIGDLCRVFAVTGKHDEKLYDKIISLKNRVFYD
jgi:hypothetical protein